MRKLFRTMILVIIGLTLGWSSTHAQTFNFNYGNSSVYIQAFSGLEYMHYSFSTGVDVRYNKPMAEIFLGPRYLDDFYKPQDAFGTFVQEFYFFRGITKTNPLDYVGPAPTYPNTYIDIP